MSSGVFKLHNTVPAGHAAAGGEAPRTCISGAPESSSFLSFQFKAVSGLFGEGSLQCVSGEGY